MAKEKELAKIAQSQPWRPDHEIWIQLYFRDVATDLGFRDLEGPLLGGPDFSAVYRRVKTDIEVEHRWADYFFHGHDEDERFKLVGVLVVLGDEKPLKPMQRFLPKRIVYLDPLRFMAWLPKGQAKHEEEYHRLRNGYGPGPRCRRFW